MSVCQVFRDENEDIIEVQAPNGKKSVLFDSISQFFKNKEEALKAWAQVYTPSFKEWFGDWENKEGSKVVDANGEPLLVYHGSNATFNIFDKTRSGEKTGWAKEHQGIHFFESKGAAESYFQNSNDTDIKTDIYAFYTIQNKKENKLSKSEFDSLQERNENIGQGLHEYGLNHFKYIYGMTYEQYSDLYKTYGKDKELINTEYEDEMFGLMDKYTKPKEELYAAFLNITDPLVHNSKGKRYVQEIKDVYDKLNKDNNGIIVKNTLDRLNDSIGFEDNVFVAFESNQVKSVFNEGSFAQDKGGYNNTVTKYEAVNGGVQDILARKRDLEAKGARVAIAGNGLKYSFDPNNIFFQDEKSQETVPSKASSDTVEKIKEFMKRAGISQVELEKFAQEHGIDLEGRAGLADAVKGLIAVAEGKEGVALPEEAMHIAVAIIKQINPTLFAQLKNDVVKYAMYKGVLEQYKSDSLYQMKDGSPNFDKIKEEAIAKILVEHVINKNEGFNEKPENLVKISSLWDKIKAFISKIFKKTNIDLFSSVAEDILNGGSTLNVRALRGQSSELFAQNTSANSQEETVNKILALDTSIEKKESPTQKDENGKPRDSYWVGGVEMLHRVTDRAKSYYDRIFRNGDINKTEFAKLVQNLYAENGTALHTEAEQIVQWLSNDEGKFEDKEMDPGHKCPFGPVIYETLYENMRARMASYPGSVFLTEVRVVDVKRSIGGSSDIFIIRPDGSVKILDWKFMDLNLDKTTDVPWYKIKAFDIQLSEYRRIVSDVLNIPLNKITAEVIPIRVEYLYKKASKDGKKSLPTLIGVEMGQINPKLEEKDYLLPVPISSQSTGDPTLDKLLTKLNALKHNIESVEVKTIQEKENKAEQLQALDRAMRHIAVKHSIEPLLNQAEVYNKDVEGLITIFNKSYKDLDFADAYKNDREQFTKDINEFGLMLDKSLDQIRIYTDLNLDLSEMFGTDVSAKAKDLQNKLDIISKEARFLERGVLNTIRALGEKIANSEGYTDITSAEVQVSGSSKLISETSKLQIKTLQVFYQKRREAQYRAEIETNQELHELEKLGSDFEAYAKSKGLNNKNMFSSIMDYKTNKLIDQYQADFYVQLKENRLAKNYDWIVDNIDVEKFRQDIAEKLQQQIDLINDKNISEEEKSILIDQKKALYSLTTKESAGWFNHYNLLSKSPLAKWESKEWEFLHKAENKPALDLYNWIIKLNGKADEIGYLPNNSAVRSFLPFVVKSFAESQVFGGSVKLGEDFIRSMTIDTDTVGYGTIDKLTNKPINKVPKYFINGTDKELSINLIKNIGLYAKALNNYKFISETEGIAKILGRIERNKESIITTKIGNAVFNKETQQHEKSTKNDNNADVFDKQIATLVYGQKYVESESFDQLLGSVGKGFEKINHVLGFKLLPEGLSERQFSLNKSLDTLNRYFQQVTLGFNPMPAISNLVGGELQLTISAGKYMTKADVMKSDLSVLGAAISGEKGKKFMAQLKYFLPFLQDEANSKLLKQLSVSKLTEQHMSEIMMGMQREGDKYVQAVIFHSLLENAVLINGEIHNAREYIRRNTDYKDRYSSGNLQEQEAKFNDLVADLLEKHSLDSQSHVDADGNLVIDGIERDSRQAFVIKQLAQGLSKRATGGLGAAEIRGLNQNIMSNSFMVFKNWIPSLIDVRFGKLKYASDVDAYEWGRARTVARVMSQEGFKSLSTLVDLITFNAFSLSHSGQIVKGSAEGIKNLEDLYQYKKRQYFEQTGKELDMSKEEFFDMVRQNIRSQAKDTLITLSMLAMFFAAKAMVPDDKEDKGIINQHKFIVKTLDRLSDEVAFYYSPTSFQTILNGSVFPSVGLFANGASVLSHFLKEMYAIGVGNSEMEQKNYVWKYVFKSFPVTSQMSNYMPLYAHDLSDYFGIKATGQARR